VQGWTKHDMAGGDHQRALRAACLRCCDAVTRRRGRLRNLLCVWGPAFKRTTFQVAHWLLFPAARPAVKLKPDQIEELRAVFNTIDDDGTCAKVGRHGPKCLQGLCARRTRRALQATRLRLSARSHNPFAATDCPH